MLKHHSNLQTNHPLQYLYPLQQKMGVIFITKPSNANAEIIMATGEPLRIVQNVPLTKRYVEQTCIEESMGYLITGDNFRFYVWNIKSGEKVIELKHENMMGSLNHFSVSAKHNVLYSSHASNGIRLWELPSLKAIKHIRVSTRYGSYPLRNHQQFLTIHTSSERVGYGIWSERTSLTLIDTDTEEELWRWHARAWDRQLLDVCITNNEKYAAVGHEEAWLFLINLATGEQIANFEDSEVGGFKHILSCSPDSSVLASVLTWQTHLFKLADLQVIRSYKNTHPIYFVDEKYFISAGDKTINMWSIDEDEPISNLKLDKPIFLSAYDVNRKLLYLSTNNSLEIVQVEL